MRAVTYAIRQVLQIVAGNQNWSTAVFAGDGELPRGARLAGRLQPLSESPGRGEWRHHCGARSHRGAESLLFGKGQTPVNQMIRIKNVPFRVVGVLTAKGQSTMGTDQDDTVLIPFSTAERKVIGTAMLGTVGTIMVSATSPEAMPEAQQQIQQLLHQRHRILRGQDDDFTIRNLADVVATAQSTSAAMSLLLASVAAVSLLVGGIGIMNIMLVSVTQGTHPRDRAAHGRRGRNAAIS